MEKKTMKLNDELVKAGEPIFAKKNALRMMLSFLMEQAENLTKTEFDWWGKVHEETKIPDTERSLVYDPITGELSWEEK